MTYLLIRLLHVRGVELRHHLRARELPGASICIASDPRRLPAHGDVRRTPRTSRNVDPLVHDRLRAKGMEAPVNLVQDRRIYEVDGKHWMVLTTEELNLFMTAPHLVRVVNGEPCSEITLRKEKES